MLRLPVQAQVVYTLSGTIRSAETAEVLPGAGVFVPALSKGTATDIDGSYSLTLPEGTYRVQYSFVGHETVTRDVTIRSNQTVDIALSETKQELKEVVIEADSYKERLESTQMSMEQVSIKEAKLLPALFGEVDIIKTLQLKPGVQSGGEGSTGLYVRGGGPDQNLMLLEDATIYNASHLFGFFSIFNPDAVQNVELYKGGFPAQFGGRLSSVVDVKLREGNKQRYSSSGGIGLISSRLTIEGPIQKGKSSFLLSGRRTYFDIFTRQINRIYENDEDYRPIPDYYFYDLNGKADFNIGEKDHLSVTAYYGNDVFGFNDDNFNFDFNWGNQLGSVRWRHSFTNDLFLTTTVYGTRYVYDIKNKFDEFKFTLSSSIRDFTAKSDLDYRISSRHTLRTGLTATHHQFTIGRLRASSDDGRVSFGSGNNLDAVEYGVYVSDDYEVSPNLAFNYGLRLSGFYNDGKNFTGLEPRLSARYALTENLSLKGSYTRMMQYVHLVSNSGASLPTDIWYPSTPFVQPQRSNQIALGLTKLLGPEQAYLISNEVYYKWMNNQIDFRDGAQLFVNNNLEAEFLFGRGYSYGTELYFERKLGRLTGWAGYTLSWTWRKFDDINDGKAFPSRYDRRHDVSVVAMYQLNDRIQLTSNWVYGTGNATSLPVGRFIMQGIDGDGPVFVPEYLKRNNYRMAAYHRLDVGVVYKLQPKRGEADLTFSLFNVYNRRNPYFIYFEQVKDQQKKNTLRFAPKQVS
ncbi:MAG: TonB-dependent receptor, partial [Hymenobacteraceae bacterium]|nr:TonB-dependent receptor [Hymenobacteraceae bacterium]MDX5397216.1 TonB-dependent receptor [Hymenobacteraceae bacterium]MDX5513292.1 TonB-dependent receptor [Hymenobacteraceae bacterium]